MQSSGQKRISFITDRIQTGSWTGTGAKLVTGMTGKMQYEHWHVNQLQELHEKQSAQEHQPYELKAQFPRIRHWYHSRASEQGHSQCEC